MLGVISQVMMKYVTKWKEFLETPYAEKNVPNQHDKLQSAQNYSDDDTIAQETTQELPAHEEWMFLSDLSLLLDRLIQLIIQDWHRSKRQSSSQEAPTSLQTHIEGMH